MVPLQVAQSLVLFSPFSFMLIPGLVQGCDVEEANVRHQGFGLPELRWFALQLEIWAASVVDLSQDPSAPDLALSCGWNGRNQGGLTAKGTTVYSCPGPAC